jgi:hypothetical protein
MDGGLSIKERRSYRRIYFTEKVKFGYDKPISNGMSVNVSPDGMNVISNKALVPESNILIKIDAGVWGVVTVEGEVIWVSSIPDLSSRMGIKFNKPNERLIRIYKAKNQDRNNHLNLS